MTLTPSALEWFRKYPSDWAARVLGIECWLTNPEPCRDQLALFNSIFTNQKTACKSGHKTGKTFDLAVAVLAWICLKPNSKVISTAPTGRQVKELLWREVNRLHLQAARRGYPLGGHMLQAKWEVAPDWFAIGFSTDEQDQGVKVQGWSGENLLFVFDEAAGIPREVWEVANTALQSPSAHIVAAGNPHDPCTPFYDACCDPTWHVMTMSSWNSPNAVSGRNIAPGTASRQWCQDMLDKLGPDDPQYKFRVLGEFPDASSFAMISLSACEAAQQRICKPGTKAAGCDVARFGNDKTVITIMHGGQIVDVIRISGADIPDVAGRCKQAYLQHGLACLAIDDTGVGGGVTDILGRSPELNVLPVNFGEQANDHDKYVNKVTEMFALLAADMKDGEIGGLPRTDITRELTGRLYKFDLKQRMQLESKKEFKERIGHSPDEADSLLLANYARRIASGAASQIAQVFV